MMHRLRLVALALVATLALAACGGTTAQAPTATPEPTEEPTARPTSTPRPKPTSKPKPTEEPTEEPAEEPTEEPSADGELRELEIGDLTTYDHPDDLFTIKVPENWTLKDNSKETEAILLWSDPSGNGFIVVDIYADATARDDEALAELLKEFLTNSFQDEPDFNLEDPKKQSDGSQLIVWSYTGTASNGAQAKLLGNSFIEQKEDKIALLTVVLPSAQFESLKPDLNKILNSFKYDPSVVIGGAGDAEPTAPADDTAAGGGELKQVEIGDLETYEYSTGLFAIDVPADWTLNDNSKPGEAIVMWIDPTQNALISVDIFAETSEQDADALTGLLQNFLEKSFGQQTDFRMDDPKEQSDGSILIVWSYTANVSGVEAKLLGNSFVEQRGDKISILSTLVPKDQFKTLVESTDKILNSYKIDPDAELP